MKTASQVTCIQHRVGLDGIRAAIVHFHSLRIVHDYVKSANIMIEEDGTFDSCWYMRENLCITGSNLLGYYLIYYISSIYSIVYLVV